MCREDIQLNITACALYIIFGVTLEVCKFVTHLYHRIPRCELTQRDLNARPDSLISSAEGAGDSVAKFTSLVRAGPGPGE